MTMEHSEGDRDRRLGDLLPLAEALREAIDRGVDVHREGPRLPIDAIIDEAFGRVAEPLLTERIAQLTPAEFAALYTVIKGDEALVIALDRIRDVQTAALQREAWLAEIGYEALTTGMLQLPGLRQHEIIEVGLFDPSLPQLAARQFAGDTERRPLHRKIGLRLIEPERGRVHVLHDTWVGPTWASAQRGTPLTPHIRGVIGTPGDDGIEPVLSLRAPMMYRIGAEETMPPQLVGYVELGTGEVLLGA